MGPFHPTRDQERDDECDLLLRHTGQNSMLGSSVGTSLKIVLIDQETRFGQDERGFRVFWLCINVL